VKYSSNISNILSNLLKFEFIFYKLNLTSIVHITFFFFLLDLMKFEVLTTKKIMQIG